MKEKQFLNPTVTVDIILATIEDGALKVLLIEREGKPFQGIHALPGGYLLAGETAEIAAIRILEEKTGVKPSYLEQLYTFYTPGRDPRGPVFSITYIALIPSPLTYSKENSQAQAPALYDIKKLPQLAFDHKDIINYGIKRLRGKLEYTTIGINVLPKLFTLSQLQEVYEVILNKKLDKRNFRKQIDQLGFIKETKHVLTGMRQRPAKLYTRAVKELEIKNF